MSASLNRVVFTCSLLACIAVVSMLLIFLTTGVGQDPLQFVHSIEDYRRLLLANPAALRATIGFDNLFIVFYATCFVALAPLLLRRGASRPVVFASLGLLLLLALLDMGENFHFLVMLAGAENSQPPSLGEIHLQVWESLFKFHVGYLGTFLLAVALPRTTALERTLAGLCWFVQLPVGVLIYVTPREVSVPLVFVRLLFFITAFVMLALIFGRRRDGDDAAGSGAPA